MLNSFTVHGSFSICTNNQYKDKTFRQTRYNLSPIKRGHISNKNRKQCLSTIKAENIAFQSKTRCLGILLTNKKPTENYKYKLKENS